MSRKLLFISIFTVLSLVFLQIPVNKLAGSKVSFTLFDMFAPISAAFLGSVWGLVSVLAVQIVNIVVHGTNVDKGVIIRLFPTLFGVLYFARSFNKKSDSRLLVVPIFAIVAFNLHPIGRSVWYYSLFWLIPIVAWRLREKSLIFKALGATFFAHSVGGAIWIWAFNLPASVWNSLIPVVVMERAIFALGISANYVLMTNLFAMLPAKFKSMAVLNKKYLLKNFS